MSVLKTIVAVKNIKGTSFVGVRAYENSQGEISNQTFIVGINYPKLLSNDLKTLKSNAVKRQVIGLYTKNDKGIVKKAYNELVTSLEKRTADEKTKEKLRLENDLTIKQSDAQSDAYTQIAKGLKAKDNALYIYGLCVRKTVLKSVEYKNVNSQAKTIIKRTIEKNAQLRNLKYKQFKLGALETLALQGVKI